MTSSGAIVNIALMISPRKSLVTLLALSLLGLSVVSSRADDGAATGATGSSEDRVKVEFPINGGVAKGVTKGGLIYPVPTNKAGLAAAAGYGINYHGGALMNDAGGVNINIIWYGNWGTDTAKTILPNFIQSLNNSPYYAINSTYTDGNGVAVTPKVNLVGQYTYAWPTAGYGTTLTDANILSLAQGSLGKGTIPAALDLNAIYLVLTAQGISERSGTSSFLTSFCGWHSSVVMNNAAASQATNMKYSFVGNGGTSAACSAQTAASPNGNVGADGMASVIAHEIVEAVTDPDGTAWWNSTSGMENGDLCAWKFGTTYSATTTQVINGTVSGASNNGAGKSATVTSAANNGVTAVNKLTTVANNSTGTLAGTSVTFTHSGAASSIKVGDLVTIPTLPAPYAGLVITNKVVTAAPTTRSFTISIATNPGTASLTIPTATTINVTAKRAGTTITFTNSGTNTFVVGDQVTVASAPAPYNVAGTAITARTNTTFTVAVATPAGTAAITAQSLAATTPAKAGTTITYTVTAGTFVVGDKVTITGAPTDYNVTNAAITSVATGSFTVTVATPANTAAATFAPAVAVTGSHTVGGGIYNMTLGGANYLIQQNWANRAPGGVCALS